MANEQGSTERVEQRKTYWVNPGIQGPFTRSVVVGSILPTLCGLIIGFIAGISAALATVGEEDISLVFKWLVRPRAIFFLACFVVVAVPLALIGWLRARHGVLSSHRIAGPMISIGRCLERVRQGDFSEEIRIRDTDLLHDLVDDLNSTFKAVRERHEEMERKIQELIAPKEDMGAAPDADGDSEPDQGPSAP